MKFAGLLFTAFFFLVPSCVFAESIDLFQSQIYLREDSSFDVTEWITYDFGSEERHGIFRTVPLTHPSEGTRPFYTRYITVEVTDVQVSDGADANDELAFVKVPYTVTETGDELEVKIGDPNKTIRGTHTYQIQYTVRGALEYHEDGVDLYWNVTGTDWEVPIAHAVARLPDPESLYINAGACYRGTAGATLPCEMEEYNGTVDFTAIDLKPGEGLTIARAVDPQQVDRVVFERLSLLVFWLVGAMLWFVGLGIFVYRYTIAHRTGATIIAQYEPYENFKPMYTGLLFDGRIDAHDITAGIVYLAEQGFFRVRRTERKKFLIFDVDDYEITVLRPYAELASNLQEKIFTLLFDAHVEVGSTVLLSKLAEDTAKQKENFKIIESLKKAAEKDLVAEGLFEYQYPMMLKVLGSLAFVLLGLLGITALLGAELIFAVVIALVTLVVSAVVLAFAYRRRTQKGYEALDYLKGFKEFLSVTEKERYAFHNAPAKSPEQFMEYLPYAIAFGVEKEWAAVFNDITIPEPDWYDGHGAAFSAINLSQSLDTFSTTLAGASGASAASSGSGSSGGGAGGGGGGSW